ncbi:conserved hypothetical protein [Listeria ivanovii FSL F6-596]|nr:conserved hypothetical protein [Listeria ivanovii FSL F6-596]
MHLAKTKEKPNAKSENKLTINEKKILHTGNTNSVDIIDDLAL